VILLMTSGHSGAPLVEETMFRGFLYPIVARRFGVGAGVIVTGVLFDHARRSNCGRVGQIGLLIGVGILLTWCVRDGTVIGQLFCASWV